MIINKLQDVISKAQAIIIKNKPGEPHNTYVVDIPV